MKVAIITNYWKNSDGGGIKTYLINLVNELQGRGIEIKVLFRDGVDPTQFHGGSNKIWFSWSCYNQLRKICPDVIHSQGTWYCLLPGFLYKKIHKCKLIHTFHTEPVNKLPKLAKLFFQRLLNGCDSVTFVSNRLKNRVEEIDGLKFKKTAITYAGVSINYVSNDEIMQFVEKFSIEKNDIVLLTTGLSSHPLKAQGLKILLESINILIKNYHNIKLIIVGKGRFDRELVSSVDKLGVSRNVIFSGHLNNPFIPLKICDIYTHITLGEGGISIALLEAMSVGKPIVATPVGGIPEAIVSGDNGILVESNANAIAAQLTNLIEHKAYRNKIGKRAELTARENFSWKRSADKFVELYSEKYQ